MDKEVSDKIFEIFTDINPHPRTELNYTNGYTLISAVLLSAQATDVGVNKATKALFEIADTPEKMIALGIEGIESYIKTIGLYKAKAKNLYKMSQQLIEDFAGEIPNNLKDLMSLAGVGQKTANVVLNEWFKRPTIAVDTHVFRVSNRLGLARSENVFEVEEQILQIISDKYKLYAHHHLILHGRYVCKARKPLCEICPVSQLCNYFHNR